MRRRKVNKSFPLTLLKIVISTLISITIVLVGLFSYNKFVITSCLNNLSTANGFELKDGYLLVNGEKINLNSGLLSIRKSNIGEPSGWFDRLFDSSKSSVTEFIDALNNSKVNFSKKFNMLVYEISSDNYQVYSNSKVKLRFSNLDDGYLLEFSNSSGKNKELYYDTSGKISSKPLEGSVMLPVRGGLNQVYIAGDVDVDSLSKNLVNTIKGL